MLHGKTVSAANSSVTTTIAANTTIANAPSAGTNETFTNAVALYLPGNNNVSNPGTVTNSYGLYVTPSTGATNNYAATFTSGNVGIGTTAPGYPLDVSGNVRATAFISTSDRRAKRNIASLNGEDSLRKICSVRPVSFQWRSDGTDDLGVIAQELLDVFPDLVMHNPDGTYAVKYNSLIAPMISSIQELNQKNQELEKKNQELESRIQALENKFEQVMRKPASQ
jgi:hypothetical protein